MKIGMLGIPFNGDGTRPETENPALALREAGMTALKLGPADRLLDYGDIDIPAFADRRDPSTRVLNPAAWKDTSREAAHRLRAIIEEVDFTIVLGGDCSILLGIFGALHLAGRRAGLVSLDGHTDYRDPASSPTGEPADLELAVLTGRGPRALTGLFGPPPLVQPENVAVVGYREPDLIAESTIHRIDCRGFRQTGADASAHRTLNLLGRVNRLWLHLDVDVLDPAVMPVAFPEPDGLGFAEVRAYLSTALRDRRFIGISVACYHPHLDAGGKAASALVELVGATRPSTA